MVPPIDLNTWTGLSEQEAVVRLKREGYNELPSAQSRGLLSIAWGTIQDPIFLLLVGGGIIYWVLGDLTDLTPLRLVKPNNLQSLTFTPI